jgi:hypothetical protein
VSGRCTNDEYEDRVRAIEFEHGHDAAVWMIHNAMWHLYDDLREHRLNECTWMTPQLRRRVAQWVVFLHQEDCPPVDTRMSCRAVRAYWSAMASTTLTLVGWCGLMAGVLLAFFKPYALMSIGIPSVSVGLAGVLLGGIANSPRAFALAFHGDTDSPWPFESRGSMGRAVRSPRLLSGTEALLRGQTA